MAEGKLFNHFLVVFCIFTVAAGVSIRLPRKNILSLTDLKNAGTTWYEMYNAPNFGETYFSIAYNVKYNFTWGMNDSLLMSRNGAWYYDKTTCYPGDTFMLDNAWRDKDKAIFADNHNGFLYYFVSSDPSQYLFMFGCYYYFWSPRSCAAEGTTVVFMVKNQRPDSFPMMSAVNDLKRNTDGALSFDGVITTMYSLLQFHYTMVGENSC